DRERASTHASAHLGDPNAPSRSSQTFWPTDPPTIPNVRADDNDDRAEHPAWRPRPARPCCHRESPTDPVPPPVCPVVPVEGLRGRGSRVNRVAPPGLPPR